MKKIILLCGMIIVLICSLFVLTACKDKKQGTEDVVSDGNDANETINEYSYKDLSFKLPSSYTKTSKDDSETAIYNTILKNDVMKMFAVGSFDVEGVDYISKASEALKNQDFPISEYEIVSREDPQTVEYNGIKVISIDVNYNKASINSNARIEYCYAQKGDTVYAICFELFSQNGKEIGDSDFSSAFDNVKNSLKFAE